MSTKLLNPFSWDLRGEQRPEPVPPKSHGLMADFDPALMQKVFDIPERKRISNVQHNRQPDNLRRRFEITKWTAFCHPETLGEPPALFNKVLSDSASEPATSQITKVTLSALIESRVELTVPAPSLLGQGDTKLTAS